MLVYVPHKKLALISDAHVQEVPRSKLIVNRLEKLLLGLYEVNQVRRVDNLDPERIYNEYGKNWEYTGFEGFFE